jgi:hypothetical protein
LVELHKERSFYHFKLLGKVVHMHAMKTYWGMEVQLHTFLTLAPMHVSG